MRSLLLLLLVATLTGCRATPPPPAPGTELTRTGDEIVVAGRFFHTGTPVKLWFDDGGFNGYATERRFAPLGERGWNADSGLPPARYNQRVDRFGGREDLDEEEREALRDGWSLDQLRGVVDQFVLHYDVCGTSAQCFYVLHDHRGLSVHFLLDLDGTIYQTLDAAERAWHAAQANSRSIGVEIANIGAYPAEEDDVLESWYGPDGEGGTRITFPEGPRLGHLDPQAVYRPARAEPVIGEVHGRTLKQYDLTDAQYEALAKLVATLTAVFPNLPADYPRDASGSVRTDQLSDEEWAAFQGLVAHWHLDENKVDPGPALDWERVVGRAGEHQRR